MRSRAVLSCLLTLHTAVIVMSFDICSRSDFRSLSPCRVYYSGVADPLSYEYASRVCVHEHV